MTDWNNLEPGADDDARLVDPLTLGGLMMCIDCNLPEITAETVTKQFEDCFEMAAGEAREIFHANLPAILKAARKRRRSHENG